MAERGPIVLSDEEAILVIDALNGRSHQLVNMADEPHSISMKTRGQWSETAEKMRQLHDKLLLMRGQHVNDRD